MTRKSTLPERPSLTETKASSVALLLLPLSFMVLPEKPQKQQLVGKEKETPKWIRSSHYTQVAVEREQMLNGWGGNANFRPVWAQPRRLLKKTTQYLKRADPSLLACCVLGPLKFKAESEFFSPNFP
ncbi:hypothetical protein SDJN03_29195, partial [Cucurbita argyrosperma subsp. sororia]